MVASHVAYDAALTSLPPRRPKISQASLQGAVGASVSPVIDVKVTSSAAVIGARRSPCRSLAMSSSYRR